MAVAMFFVGLFVGGFLGVVTMCCFQINRINEYEREITKLKSEQSKTE